MSTNKEKTFFGHPRGLATLFNTEFWERFSYYGMRALLLYYMYTAVADGGLGFSQSTATAIMSIYGSLVFMSGVIGGWFADRVLGARKTIFYGGVLIMVGHIVLALPNGGAAALFGSMAFIILGTGLLKPNVSNVVGDLYPAGDNRRDAGKKAPNPLQRSEAKSLTFKIIGIILGIGLLIAVLTLITGSLTIDTIILAVTVMGVGVPLAYFIMMMTSKKTEADEKSRLTAYIPLFLIAVLFWMIEEQGSSTLALFAAERTDLSIWGMNLNPANFQSLNPVFVITLSPIFAWIWTKLGDRQPSTPRKFALGLFFAGLSFVVMMLPGILHGNTTTLVSPLWLVLSFFICIFGEMFISPVGLSATTKLAPKAFASQTMSLWFLSDAMGQSFNAQLTQLFNADTEIAYFGITGFVAIAFAIALFIFAPFLKKYMKGVH
ncbi:TPA_asm: MFS transporter [Listeria monocytogenes]|nr:MFS transporter [Listeria monocytogenes]